MDLYFSQHFKVDPARLEDYGALNMSVVSDLPLFVDPFLLFNSEDHQYQALHGEILKYLLFLRDLAATKGLDEELIENLYCFREVKQNWLGFTLFGNEGHGLGRDFAVALHGALGDIFADFGEEKITQDTHLEKLYLIHPGVGKDNISDFTTNLIKGYLCEYTQAFTRKYLAVDRCNVFSVERAVFNYESETWEVKRYFLPRRGDDFVLLTPLDIFTRDDTWINRRDMIGKFESLRAAVPNAELRARINEYFRSKLGPDAHAERRRDAAAQTIVKFPELMDRYIKLQEDAGDRAEAVSADKVEDLQRVLIQHLASVVSDLEDNTEFYDMPWTSYEECLIRAKYLKAYVERVGGHKLLTRAGRPFSTEEEMRLALGIVWCKNELDVDRNPTDGRGPENIKASYGGGPKSLIEFKLGSNRQLARSLEKQRVAYKNADRAWTSVTVIVYYTVADERRVIKILKELDLEKAEWIVLIDGRSDSKLYILKVATHTPLPTPPPTTGVDTTPATCSDPQPLPNRPSDSAASEHDGLAVKHRAQPRPQSPTPPPPPPASRDSDARPRTRSPGPLPALPPTDVPKPDTAAKKITARIKRLLGRD